MPSIRTPRSRACSTLSFLLFLLIASGGFSPVMAQAVPDRVLVGYWHNWGFSPNNLTLATLPDAYDVINVSFAVPSTVFGSTMTFAPDANLYPNAADFLTDVQALQAQGKKVLISIGGANGPVHLDAASDISAFVTSMVGIINAWGFDGLDIDLEGGSLMLAPGDTNFASPTTPRVVNFIAAMNQLLAMMPADFMLTAAPETATLQGGTSAYGGVWGGYLPVIHALRNDLDWVQTQHYNTGSMLDRNGQIQNPGTADFHVAMADMLISGFAVPASGMTFPPLAPSQVVIGLPASARAAGSGFTAASIVHEALDHLYLGLTNGSSYALGAPGGYPDFRGVMTWSINWDVSVASSFSGPHREYLDALHLALDADSISLAAGGVVNLSLRAGVAHAGRPYLLVPTLSGTAPGTPLQGGFTLPINLDALSYWPLQVPTNALFPGFQGTLDGSGNAGAMVLLPPTPGGANAVAHFAFLLGGPIDFVSDAQRLLILP